MSTAKAQVVEVVPGLYRLADIRSVNAYVWRPRPEQRAEAEPILFDCGWPWSGRALVSSLAALSCRPTEIKKIAITHADLDHAGRLASLQAVSGAEVIAHSVEAERLTHDSWRALPGNRGPLNVVARVAALYSTRWPPHPVRATSPGAGRRRDRRRVDRCGIAGSHARSHVLLPSGPANVDRRRRAGEHPQTTDTRTAAHVHGRQ